MFVFQFEENYSSIYVLKNNNPSFMSTCLLFIFFLFQNFDSLTVSNVLFGISKSFFFCFFVNFIITELILEKQTYQYFSISLASLNGLWYNSTLVRSVHTPKLFRDYSGADKYDWYFFLLLSSYAFHEINIRLQMKADKSRFATTFLLPRLS